MNARAIVLLYHSVTDDQGDPFELKVRPENFAAHMEALGGMVDVVPLAAIRDRARARRVAVTFDDGYEDNDEVARPILEQTGVPATVFITSDVLNPGYRFWWDRLTHLLLDAVPERPTLQLTLGGRRLFVDVRTRAGRGRALAAVQRRIRHCRIEEIESVLDQIRDQLGKPPNGWQPPRQLNADQVRALTRGGLIDVGGHTRSHVMLSALSPSEQREEIAGCKAALEHVVGRPVTTFAYPFGTRESFGRRTASLVRDAGFRLACTAVAGGVYPRTHAYRIPRVTVRDLSGKEFAQLVARALGEGGG